MHFSKWPGLLALSILVLSPLTPPLSASTGATNAGSGVPRSTATARARGLDLHVFGSAVTIGSSAAAIDRTTARSSAAGVSLDKGTVSTAEVRVANTRQASRTCLPSVALFEVVRVQVACGESRTQILPAVFADDMPRHTGAAMIDRSAAPGGGSPTSPAAGGPQAVGRGSAANVDVDGTHLLRPAIDQLRALLTALEPRAGDTVDAVTNQIGGSSAKVVRALAGNVGLHPTDVVHPVVALLRQLVDGSASATGLVSTRLSVSTATSNTEPARMVGFANAGEAHIDLLPGMVSGATPLLSIVVGAAQSTSYLDRATGGVTPAIALPFTKIKLGLALAGNGVTELTVSPGTPVTLLAGTPLETTVSVGDGRTTTNPDGSLSSVVDGVSIQLLKGVKGPNRSKNGIDLQVAHVESGVGGPIDLAVAGPGGGLGPVPVLAAGTVLVASVILLAYTVRGRARRPRSSKQPELPSRSPRPTPTDERRGIPAPAVSEAGAMRSSLRFYSTRRPARVVIAVVMCLLVAGVALREVGPWQRTRAQMASGPAVGTVADLTWGIPRAEMDRSVTAMRDAGIKWVRANQNWAGGEPDAKNVLNTGWLAEIDYAVTQARAAGMQVLMPIADGVPYWASADPAKYIDGGGVKHWNKLWRPTNASDYADFARAMVSRYKPLGVQTYEVWNEPNHPFFWPSGPSANEYVALLSAAYPAIKAADPTAKVILGGLSKSDYDYLAALYAAGAGQYFDAVAIHPYTGAVDPTWCWNQASTVRYAKDAFCGIEEVRNTMVANGDAAKSIWLTEFGWSTTTAAYGVSEAVQASFLTAALTKVQTSYPYVTHALWYNFRNTFYFNDDPAELEANWGLVRTGFGAKPALAAMKDFTASLAPATISISDVKAPEASAGTTTNAAFTVSLSAPAAAAVTVKASTANGSATAGSDYTALAVTTVSFAPGETTKTLTVPVLGDSVAEGNETFTVNLSSPAGGVLADGQGLGTILDDEGTPTFAVSNGTAVEGAPGATTSAAFTVSLSAPAAAAVTVKAATANGSATAGSDYTAMAATTVSFAPGETTKTLTVPVLGDSVAEGNETFTVNLSSPLGGVLADGQGLVTVLDDEGAPTMSISDVSIVEGAPLATTSAAFTVTLSAPAAAAVTVKAATANGSAAAGSDYTAMAATTVSFSPGETTKTLTVPVIGDSAAEGDENFNVNLSSPVGAVLADAQGRGTVVDDEGAPTISITDASVPEGAAGASTKAAFNVSLSAPAAAAVTVKAATANGSATAGSDYTALAVTTVSFAPGETTKTLTVAVLGDSVGEANETFTVNLSSPVGAVLADAQGLGTIVDDDVLLGLLSGEPGPALSISNATVVERAPGVTTNAAFTVSLSAPAPLLGVTVKAATANGSATAGSDYTAVAPTTVSFGLGETSKTITVAAMGDSVAEGNETFTVDLSSPVGAVLADAQGLGIIADDEGAPTISITDATVVEAAPGVTANAAFTVTLSAAAAAAVTVKAATANGSATAGSDYTALAATTVSFAAGQTSKTVSLAVAGDSVAEGNETFNVNLSSPVGAVLADTQGLATVQDDD